MAQRETNDWNIERFLDSFIIELDKAQDTLAVKGINRKLTYTVKDVSLDLHVFPTFQNGKVLFSNAKSGDTGFSKMSIQLGSITDAQIAQHTSEPISGDDIAIDDLEGVDEETKLEMRRIGVKSAKDISRMENRNIKVDRVLGDSGSDKKNIKEKYDKLANMIQKARRKQSAPRVKAVSLGQEKDASVLKLDGDNLIISRHKGYPTALINDIPVEILASDGQTIQMSVAPHALGQGSNKLKIALDPYAVISMEIDG
ncbi:MAG: hypothetical protein KKD73_01215 [Proteobacteria bacterium]|nr:hypothetical protein [Pseudomonadota bacterium]MBU1641117.1 hypothetical protein [Pseudomonadota bacterium]